MIASLLITIVFLTTAVIVLSWLFNKLIEKPLGILVNKMFKNVF